MRKAALYVLDRIDPLLGQVPLFRLLWFARGVSRVGDELFDYVLLMMTTAAFGGVLKSGTVGVAISAPFLLFGLISGTYLDRWYSHRGLVMRLADVLRLLLVAAFAVIPLSVSSVWAWLAYSVVFLASTGSVFSDNAGQAALPNLFSPERRDQIRRANALLASQYSMVQVIVPSVCVLLLLYISPRAIFAINAASFLLSFALLRSVATYLDAKPAEHSREFPKQSPLHIWGDISQGVKVLFSDRLLRLPLATVGLSNMLVFSLVFTLPALLSERKVDPLILGPAFGLLALGRFVGSFGAARWGSDHRLLVALIAEPAIRAVALVAIVLSVAAPVLLVALFAIGLPQGYAQVARVTLLQTRFPDTMRGRIFGQYMVLNRSLLPLGAAFTQLFLDRESAALLIVVMAVSFAFAAGALILDPHIRSAISSPDATAYSSGR